MKLLLIICLGSFQLNYEEPDWKAIDQHLTQVEKNLDECSSHQAKASQSIAALEAKKPRNEEDFASLDDEFEKLYQGAMEKLSILK